MYYRDNYYILSFINNNYWIRFLPPDFAKLELYIKNLKTFIYDIHKNNSCCFDLSNHSYIKYTQNQTGCIYNKGMSGYDYKRSLSEIGGTYNLIQCISEYLKAMEYELSQIEAYIKK